MPNDDLWNALTSGRFSAAVQEKTKKRRKARTPAGKRKAQSVFEQTVAALGIIMQEMKRPDPDWKPIGIALHRTHIHCACGHTHTSTATTSPLVIFQHLRNGALKYEPSHPSRFRPDLPRRFLDTHTHVEFCEACFLGSGTDQSIPHNTGPVQMDLFLDNTFIGDHPLPPLPAPPPDHTPALRPLSEHPQIQYIHVPAPEPPPAPHYFPLIPAPSTVN